jgi:hypothetical protein
MPKITTAGGAPEDTSSRFAKWLKEVDELFLTEYFIDCREAGIEIDRLLHHWGNAESPKEFVSWFAAQYDLTSGRDVMCKSHQIIP